MPDRRVEALSDLFQPKKKTFAKVECHDLPSIGADEKAEARLFAQMRELDALALVVRGFEDASFAHARASVDVAQDLERLHAAFQFSDFVQVESRVDKLEKSVNKPSKTQERDKKELGVLQKLKVVLEKGGKVEDVSLHASEEELIRGFRFLTQKPVLVVLNLPEDGKGEAALRASIPATFPRVLPIRGSLEAEIAQLEAADAAAFMKDYGITEPARDRLIAALYELLGLCSFLTAGEDECRAWTIKKGTSAAEAAGSRSTPTSSAASSAPKSSPSTTSWRPAASRRRRRPTACASRARSTSSRTATSSTSASRSDLGQAPGLQRLDLFAQIGDLGLEALDALDE